MRISRCFVGPMLVVCALLLAGDKIDEPKIDVRVAKYDELGELIKNQKGKIVVVDFWQDS
jgi:hypothetical protein